MDVSDLKLNSAAEEGVWFEVYHPLTDEVLEGTWIRVRSLQSDTFRQTTMRIGEELLEAGNRQQRRRRTRRANLTAEEQREVQLRATAEALLVDWRGIEERGTEVSVTEANALRLLREYPWLYEQVLEAAQDRAAFVENAEGNSARTPGSSSSGRTTTTGNGTSDPAADTENDPPDLSVEAVDREAARR